MKAWACVDKEDGSFGIGDIYDSRDEARAWKEEHQTIVRIEMKVIK